MTLPFLSELLLFSKSFGDYGGTYRKLLGISNLSPSIAYLISKNQISATSLYSEPRVIF
jgi:hypothetical protein